MRIRDRAGLKAAGIALAALVAACGGGSGSHTTSESSAATLTSASTTSVAQATTTTATTHRTSTRSTHSREHTSSTTETTPTTTTTTTTATPTTTSSTTTTVTSTSTQTTRSESGPAFVTTPPAGGRALSAAIAVLAHHGFTPLDTSSYGPHDTLHVLIGVPRAGGPGQRAFFFNEQTYLGTDASTPSAEITVLAHSDSEVTLGYTVVRGGVGALRRVRFALDMGQLTALDPLPSAAERR